MSMPEKDSGKILSIFRMSGELKHRRQDLLELFDQLAETLDEFDIPDGLFVDQPLGVSYTGFEHSLRWDSFNGLHIVQKLPGGGEFALQFDAAPVDMQRMAADWLDSLLVEIYDQLKREDDASEAAIIKLSKIKEWLS